ncbi:MAG: ribbon-helix-helix protein, CopG family [Proteobacteria bacterium]|nr:MAG: ribbon-helix-helix protein, CopG family [Pseudomonadota bacterium]
MKVVKVEKKFRSVTLRLPEKVMVGIDKIADRNELSRQQLIAAILEQVIQDEKFVLKMKG